MSERGFAAKQQIKKKKVRFVNEVQGDARPVQIHGLSVERYREIYNSVLAPPVLAALSSHQKHTDYVSQVLELKQCLWTKLGQPRLQETVMEDGRVEVKEICDLT